MTIASRLAAFLEQSQIDFDIVSHPYAERALDTAHNACIPSRTMAKAVVLEDEKGVMMAVLPANNNLNLDWLNHHLDRHLHLMQESSLKNVFPDCQLGAIPAIGQPWGISMACDNTLDTVTDIYLEGGNHRELVHMHREQYQSLTHSALHETISCPPDDRDIFACTPMPDK